LRSRGYAVLGISRTATVSFGFDWEGHVDIGEPQSVFRMLSALQPREVYHLAAFHHSSEQHAADDPELLVRSYRTNVFTLHNLLEGIRACSPKSRLFYAASSMVFGEPAAEVQDEATPFDPTTLYGITKASGVFACRLFRKQYGVFASTGILYNHESQYRGPQFVSQKIVRAAVAIAAGVGSLKLVLGDLSSEVDWGYAPDFVEAFHAVLDLPAADDFIVATGVKHSVRDFVEVAFKALGLAPEAHVIENKGVMARRSVVRVGDAAKLRRLTGWRPTCTFDEMVRRLVDAESARLREASADSPGPAVGGPQGAESD
jgi:GDPmannose 4,6-dehydratase